MTVKYDGFDALMLEVWRVVGWHLRLEEAVARIQPLLQAAMGVGGILVRRLDATRHRIETVASAGMPEGVAAGEAQLDAAEWSTLMRWCRSATPALGEASRLAQRLPVSCRAH